MEIMGLAIIIILVSLGFLFILKFNVSKKPAELHKEFTKIETASNFLNSLLRTTSIDCYDLSFTEIFQDCGKGSLIICENGMDSCKYIENKTKEILTKTLNVWNFHYELTAYVNPELNKIDPLISPLGGCPTEWRSKFFYLPLDTAPMTIRMNIC